MIPSKNAHLTEDKFKVFFDASPDAIFIEDNAGNNLYANNSACQLHEMVLEELIGKNVDILMPKEVKKKFKNNHKNFEKHKTEVIESFSLTKNGKEIPIELRITRLSYPITKFIATFTSSKRSRMCTYS